MMTLTRLFAVLSIAAVGVGVVLAGNGADFVLKFGAI